MKVYFYYYQCKEMEEHGAPPLLYAYTNNKELARQFIMYRKPKKFPKIVKHMSREEYEEIRRATPSQEIHLTPLTDGDACDVDIAMTNSEEIKINAIVEMIQDTSSALIWMINHSRLNEKTKNWLLKISSTTTKGPCDELYSSIDTLRIFMETYKSLLI